MKKFSVGPAVLAVSVLFSASQLALAASQAFEGTVSDSMCEKKHMMPGKSAAQCTEECLKMGSTYVLVTEGKVYPLVAKKGVLTPFAGKHVQVQGELTKNSIAVSSIR